MKRLLPVGIALGLLAAAVGLYLFQPWRLFTTVEVNEAAPAAIEPPPSGTAGPRASTAPGTASGAPSLASAAPDQADAAPSPASAAPGQAEAAPGTASAAPDRAGATPSAVPASPKARLVATGMFRSHEHSTAGEARLLHLPDGRRVLRIENLQTSDGPDLRVWLSDQPVTDDWFNLDDGKWLELGDLKGNKGNANYAIPAGADLDRFTSVTIWCKRFSVSFGAATLTPPA